MAHAGAARASAGWPAHADDERQQIYPRPRALVRTATLDQNDPCRHMTIDVAMLMSGGVTRKHDIVPIRHARGTEISLLGAITDAHPFTFLVDPAPPRLGVTALLPHIEHGEHAVRRGIDSPHAPL